MDIIARAMEKNLHFCEELELKGQTWNSFYKNKRGKNLFLFGAGEGMGYFFRNCCDHMDIIGVVDNDCSRQKQKLGWCCAEVDQTEYEELVIDSPEILKTYLKDNVIVLITNINSYFSVVKQLKQMGIVYIYALLVLEADKRKNQGIGVQEDLKKLQSEYIDWCCRQTIEGNKIIMLIGTYGGHARQITKALLKERKDLDIVWVTRNQDVEKPSGVRLVCKRNWKKYFYEMETAKIWLFDDIISLAVRKRENQIYIQVKHWSSITLKKFYLDDTFSCMSMPAGVTTAIKEDGARMDYLLSGSEFDERSCRSGFGFKGKAVRVGSARSDVLFDRTIREKVLRRLDLDTDVKVCLYVPTYRRDEFERTHSMSILLNMEAILEVLNDKWEGNWFLLVRLHPNLMLENAVLPQKNKIVNVQNYDDSEELVAAADVMITDYSSIMFEGAYGNKPVFLYAPDKEKFVEGERSLLIDYDRLPFPVAESDEELHHCIRFFKEEEYEKKVKDFLEEYDVCEDGHASERAAEFIGKLLEGNEHVCE